MCVFCVCFLYGKYFLKVDVENSYPCNKKNEGGTEVDDVDNVVLWVSRVPEVHIISERGG